MSRFLSFLIAAGAVTATVLLITVNNPYLQRSPEPEPEKGSAVPVIPAPPVPAAETAPAPPPPPLPVSWFSLDTGTGMSVVLRGVLPTTAARQSVVESVTRGTPELFVVKDEIQIEATATTPRWLGEFANLAGGLVGSVQEPSLRLGPDTAVIGGSSDREHDLAALRTRFQSLATDYDRREDRLRLDPSRPARDTRMPLVLYLAVVEGVYRFEGSLPSHGLVQATSEAASASAGEDRFSGNLRVSQGTVDEPWMASLPALVAALLEGKRDGMELIVVDRVLTLKGEVPDEPTKEKLLELAKPAREAGYAVKDELTVKSRFTRPARPDQPLARAGLVFDQNSETRAGRAPGRWRHGECRGCGLQDWECEGRSIVRTRSAGPRPLDRHEEATLRRHPRERHSTRHRAGAR